MLRRYHRVAREETRDRDEENLDEELAEVAPGKVSLVEASRLLAKRDGNSLAVGKVTRTSQGAEHSRARERRQRRAALLQAQRDQGEALPLVIRRSLEAALGIDLSAVRLHRGPGAAAAARVVDAAAFAAGRDIYFGEGQYAPDTESGRRLLAHEVAHTAQAPAVAGNLASLPVSSPGDRHEVAADAFAAAFAAGAPTPQVAPAPAPVLSRTPTSAAAASTSPAPAASTSPAPAGEEPDHDALLTAAGIDSRRSPRLHAHIKEALDAADNEMSAAVESGDVASITAAGRKAWRKATGDDFVYLCQLADELGDSSGKAELRLVRADTRFEDEKTAAKLKADYFGLVADIVERARDGVAPPALLSGPEASPLIAVVKSHPELLGEGTILSWTDGNPLLHRFSLLADHYSYHTKREHWSAWNSKLRGLVREDAHDQIESYVPITEFRTLSQEFYAYEVSRDPEARSGLAAELNRETTLDNMTAWESLYTIPLDGEGPQFNGLLSIETAAEGLPQSGLVHLWLSPDKIAADLAGANAAPRKPTTFDYFASETLPAVRPHQWLVPDADRIAALRHTRFVKEGAAGIDVTPAPNLTQLHENIAAFMAQFGNAEGKAKFSANNAPTSVAVDVGGITEVWLPPGAKNHVSMSDPGITHPGARVKQLDLRLRDGANDDDKLVRSGRARMDIEAGGAFEKKNADVALEPPRKASEGAADAETPEQDGPQIKNVRSPLDRILGRVDLDGSLIDGGFEVSAKVKPGRSGIPGIEIDQADFLATYKDGAVDVGAKVALHDRKRRLQASADIGWDGAEFSVRGDGAIELDGFPKIEASFEHVGGETAIQVKNEPTFHKDFSAITLDGKARGLKYETGRRGGLSGDVEVKADLGILGEADAAAEIKDSELDRLAIDLQSREISFAAGGTPLVTGLASGQIEIAEGRPSGEVHGAAQLHIPQIDSVPDLDLDLRVTRDGEYRGGIRARNIELGSFLHLKEVDVDFGDGKPSGHAKVAVNGIPFMDKCDIGVKVSESGIELSEAKVELSGLLDEVTRDRLDAKVGLADDSLSGTLTLKEGPSGIPGFDLGESAINFTAQNGQLTKAGAAFSLAYNPRQGGKGKKEDGSFGIRGIGSMEWNGEDWDFSGAVIVTNLTEGLSPFGVSVKKTGKDLQVAVTDDIAYHRDFGAITFDGKATGVEYNVRDRSFSGEATIDADLGMFGKAGASAKIVDNDLEEAELNYESPDLRYPADESKTALLSGTATGNIRYRRGKFSGGVRSRASIELPDVLRIGTDEGADLAADIRAQIHEDGSYSGSVRSLQPIEIGKHFRVPRFHGEIDKEGNIASDFSVAIVNFKKLDHGKADCRIDNEGLHIVKVDAGMSFGDENDRMWGEVNGSYSETEGLLLAGKTNVRIRDDLIGTGELSYSTKTNAVSGELSTTPIELLTLGDDARKTLFEFSRKIPVISVGVAGAYIDIGLDVGFNYKATLAMTPAIQFENLDFDTFSFDKAIAKLNIGGELSASLSTTPKIGVGVFLFAPEILSGGGGIAFDIVGKASANPSANLEAAFDQHGNLQAGGRLAFPLSFGVTAALIGFADYSILSGYVAEGGIRGQLTSPIEIVPETEIFRFEVDFGKRIGPPEDPKAAIPEKAEAPKSTGDAEVVPQASETETTEVPQAPPTSQGQDIENDTSNDQGLGIESLLGGLKSNPTIQKLDAVIEAAKKVWDSMAGLIGDIGHFFVQIVDTFGEAIEDVLNGIAEHGPFGYLRILLKDILGDDAYFVLEPMLLALDKSENELIEIITNFRAPTGATDFIAWTFELLGELLDFGLGSIGDLIDAVGKMYDNLVSVAGGFLNRLIQEGKLGVNRYPYYIGVDEWYTPDVRKDFLAPTEWKLQIGSVNIYDIDRGMITSPSSVVAYGLWELLERFPGVEPTNTAVEDDSGDPYNDYWTGSPAKWDNK